MDRPTRKSAPLPDSTRASRAALVTGGAVRLGRAIALGLARSGYHIALHYNASQAEATATAAEIRKFGVECEIYACNFGERPDFSELVERARARFPGLAVLINSASVYDQAPLLETDGALLDRQFAVNFRAPYLLTKAFALACGHGNVINIIDNKIAFEQYQYSAYLLSKKALADLTRLAAAELAPAIRVNGVAPGVILPAGERSPEYIRWREEAIPLRRKGTVEEIHRAIDYLLENEFVTGQILTVDGGESLGPTGRNAAGYSTNSASPRHRAVLSVGSNIDPERNVQAAAQILASEHRLVAKSRLIVTPPDGYQDQPDFLNGAYLVETALDYESFNDYLKTIEKRLGRVKGPIKSGPRTIDLDIIVWDDEITHPDYPGKDYTRQPVDELLERFDLRASRTRPAADRP